MKYNLNRLVNLARILEEKLIPFGVHVAIGGSCLHKGESNKDMDVFIYPHNDEDILDLFDVVFNEIEKLGFIAVNNSHDSTRVFSVHPTKFEEEDGSVSKIDFFFMQRISYEDEQEKDNKNTNKVEERIKF